jgi:hypothetical protein
MYVPIRQLKGGGDVARDVLIRYVVFLKTCHSPTTNSRLFFPDYYLGRTMLSITLCWQGDRRLAVFYRSVESRTEVTLLLPLLYYR